MTITSQNQNVLMLKALLYKNIQKTIISEIYF
jgi:hypothetical protein